MTIAERIQTEFPGITAMITGIVNALRAHHVYNRALKDMEVFKMKSEKLIEVYKYIVVHKNRYGDTLGYLEAALVSIEIELNLSHPASMALRREALEMYKISEVL